MDQERSQVVPKGGPRDPQGVPKGSPRDPKGHPRAPKRVSKKGSWSPKWSVSKKILSQSSKFDSRAGGNAVFMNLSQQRNGKRVTKQRAPKNKTESLKKSSKYDLKT